MQPVFPYRPQSYPPRGRMWPQFGDEVLEDTLSFSQGAQQSLNKKREVMRDFHNENLEHHGLAPRGPPPPPPPPAALEEPGGAQEELPFHLHETDPEPPRRPNLHAGASYPARPAGAIHYADDNLPFTTPDYNMEPQRGSVQEGLQHPGTLPSQSAPLRARESFRTHQQSPGLATQLTPQFASDMPIDQMDDADIANRVVKRGREAAPDRKVKVKTEPKLVPVKEEKIKLEPAVKIKQENEVSHRGPGSSSSSTQPLQIRPDDDELITTRVNFNNNENMSYWEQASANEMKAQLNLRFPQLSGNWQYKGRAQLISTIRGLIRTNQWKQGESTAATESSRARSRSPQPSRPAPPAVQDDDDEELEVSGVTWEQNIDPAFWEQQSANFIRKQLTAKFPTGRHNFAFLETRAEYIKYITDLIRKGKYP